MLHSKFSPSMKVILIMGVLTILLSGVMGTICSVKLTRCIPLAKSEIHSWHDEELLIRDFFAERKNGFFVDVGANHYMEHSNTYYLEKKLDWSGIAVDALPQFAEGYEKFRPRTRFFSFFVSDQSDESIEFFEHRTIDRVSSSTRSFTESRGDYITRTVPTITLNDLLESEGVVRFDFLSMDIELAEPLALAGFDIAEYRPELVCIEAHPPVKEQILEYFERNGYQIVEKYLSLDSKNLYYTPIYVNAQSTP